MSEVFKHTAGLQNVGSYQVSGKPFVTASTVTDGSEQQIQFPEVSNNITVKLDSSSGGAGTTYNSVEIKGVSVYYINDTTVNAQNGDSRTISTWISASVLGGSENGIIIAGTTIANQFCIREKAGNFQFMLRTSSGIVALPGTISPLSGWFHIAYIVKNNDYARAFINGVSVSNLDITGQQTVGTYLGGGLVLGPPGDGDTDIKFRDSILWDNALTDSEVLALYQASASYTDAAFNVANKLVWVKPEESISSTPVNTLTNSGDSATYGNMVLTGYEPGETAEVVADAPFADISGGGGGSLRVHFRSTGSSNVATNRHYWNLDSQNESITMNVKSKELYLSADGGDCDYSVEAELTGIDANLMYQHTGSGVDE